MKHAFDVKVSNIVQKESQFVIHALQIYHGNFKMGYHVAKATNFAEYLWPDIGSIVAASKERDRLTLRCNVPIEKLFW